MALPADSEFEYIDRADVEAQVWFEGRPDPEVRDAFSSAVDPIRNALAEDGWDDQLPRPEQAESGDEHFVKRIGAATIHFVLHIRPTVLPLVITTTFLL